MGTTRKPAAKKSKRPVKAKRKNQGPPASQDPDGYRPSGAYRKGVMPSKRGGT